VTSDQAQARYQQQVEELCAASIRAISGEPDLHFRSRRLHRGQQALPLFAPHLQPSLEDDDFASYRGVSDGIALRLLYSDAVLHRELSPVDAVERWLFEFIEQCRVEGSSPNDMPGISSNLRHRFEAWSRQLQEGGAIDSDLGVLLFTIVHMVRSRVTGEPIPEPAEGDIELTRGAIAPFLGHALSGLRRERFDQAAYARHALEICGFASKTLHAAEDAEGRVKKDAANDQRKRHLGLLLDFDAKPALGIASVASGEKTDLIDASYSYQVFSRDYDKVLQGATLARPEVLAKYREQLDRRIALQSINVAQLARRLKVLLSLPLRDRWQDEQEEGRIDGRHLARLITSPNERRLFRSELIESSTDVMASFLIDCSGSMKQHIESTAMLVDVFARALEQAGAETELLGFTTGAWNGGRPRREWLRAGRPENPGRLNETWHIVFKDAETPWRRARRSIAALLKADLFREGIDGEAVEWACGRMLERPVRRRMLFVISDGCPMDGATSQANDEQYLDLHLREVIARIDAAGQVQIFGIGVGLDLSPYYAHCQAVDFTHGLSNHVFQEILGLMAGRTHR